ncbi:MAG TPA: hypothetical protein VG125_09715 [Pirellulales bacterium]|jgi:hypothetical protein|nr:hypothetical protein [Pirellulales bacterium]
MNSTSVSRPGGVTALCVLTIVLGSLGLLTGLATIGTLVFGAQMQSAVAGLQPDAEAARVQREIAEEADEMMRQHLVRNWILVVVRLNVAMGLLLGGIWSLHLKPIGRTTLLAVFGLGIVLEVFQLWPTWEARDVSARTFERIMQTQQQQLNKAPPGFDATMKIMGQVMATVQLVMAVAMFLAKSGFYGFGLWYLTRPRVASLFLRTQPVDPQWA